MKRALLIMITTSLLFSFAVQAQLKPKSPVFGTDVQIYSYFDCMQASAKVSVADNGWIYVLSVVDAPGITYKAWRIWRSIDEGVTFSYVCNWEYYTTNNNLKDADLVVTGNDPSNINIWVAEVCNTGSVTPNNPYARITQWDANGNYIGTPYYLDYGAVPNELYSIDVTSDYRSPGAGSSPFAIGCAFTGHFGGRDYLTYVYSLNGGVVFIGSDPYSEAGTNKLGRVSIALGGTATYNFGRYGIAFEMNKSGDLGDIGVLSNYTDNAIGSWTSPVAVNLFYPPMSQQARFPTISIMDNISVNPSVPNFFPFLIAYEDWSSGATAVDLAFSSFAPASNPSIQPTLGDFTNYWMGNGSGYNELEPNLAFDKAYNNMLLTYSSGDNNQLYYKVSNVEDFQSNLWADFGNYRDPITPFTWQVAPKVDINPVKAQVCFTWVEQASDYSQSAYFDAEWSTVGINDHRNKPLTDFSLYPNPAKDIVNLDIQKQGEYTLIITDNMGRNILNKKVMEGNQQISLTRFSKGIYMVRIFGNNFDSSRKLIIE